MKAVAIECKWLMMSAGLDCQLVKITLIWVPGSLLESVLSWIEQVKPWLAKAPHGRSVWLLFIHSANVEWASSADAVGNRLDKAPASSIGASFHGKRQTNALKNINWSMWWRGTADGGDHGDLVVTEARRCVRGGTLSRDPFIKDELLHKAWRPRVPHSWDSKTASAEESSGMVQKDRGWCDWSAAEGRRGRDTAETRSERKCVARTMSR